MMANWRVIAVSLVALVCSSCASGPSTGAGEALIVPVYQLAPDDRLRIAVYGEPELTGEFTVASNGAVSFPLVGSIKASGLTLEQLEQALRTQLNERYLKEPKVSASIIDYRPFYVLGEVNKAGQYPYRVGMTVNAAVATAGGFTYRANHRTVAIQRFGTAGEVRYALTPDLQIGAGDTVRVLERFF